MELKLGVSIVDGEENDDDDKREDAEKECTRLDGPGVGEPLLERLSRVWRHFKGRKSPGVVV